MELLYVHEHTSCFNYENGNRPVIQTITFKKGDEWNIDAIYNKVVFFIKGDVAFSMNKHYEDVISEQKFILIPSSSNFSLIATSDTVITIFRLLVKVQLCDRFALENLLLGDVVIEKKDTEKVCALRINERMSDFLTFLNQCTGDGLKCFYFFEIKMKEFFFLLRAYYTKEDLRDFFRPLLSPDQSFSDLVIKNYHNAKTVKELAELTNYSVSGFEKRFKKVFGMSASAWIKKQRDKVIYHAINHNEKSFKEISDDFGFYSTSHFNDYCKSRFGETPGSIRKKTQKDSE